MGLRVARTGTCARAGCGLSFTTKDSRKTFCSQSCSAKVSNANRKSISKKVARKCSGCDEQTYNPKYCSIPCGEQHKRDKQESRIADWLAGKISVGTGELHHNHKQILYSLAGGKCPECGWHEVNEYRGYAILTVDHIDGDWRNNFISNLRVLCFNCHSLTPTFGALNMGSRSDQTHTSHF